MSRAGAWCDEHGNGYDDCSFLHQPALPVTGFEPFDPEDEHRPDATREH